MSTTATPVTLKMYSNGAGAYRSFSTYSPLFKMDFSSYALGAQPVGANGFAGNVPASPRFNTSTDFTDPLTGGQVLKLAITNFDGTGAGHTGAQQAFGGNMYTPPSPITLSEGKEMWCRIFHRFPSGYPFGTNPANLPIGNGDGAPHVKLFRFDCPDDSHPAIFYLDNFGAGSTGATVTSSCTIGFYDASPVVSSGMPDFPTQTVIDTSKWYCLEWYVKFSNAGNGAIRAWVDGTFCGEVTGINTVGAGTNGTATNFVYGNYKNGGFPANCAWYLANIICTMQTPDAIDSGGRPMIGTTRKASDFV